MVLYCVMNKSPQHYTSFTQQLYGRLIASIKHNIAITHFTVYWLKLLSSFLVARKMLKLSTKTIIVEKQLNAEKIDL